VIGLPARIIGDMGYLGYFYVETKAFEFRSNVQGGVQLEEKSRGKTRSVIMAWPTIFWLVSAWDYLTTNVIESENWRTFRFGCYSYIVQRRKNSYGKYLELSEYGGKGRRSYVIIPEGNEGKGWKDGRQQLQRLKTHHEKQKQKQAGPLCGASEGGKGEEKMSGATEEMKPVKAQRSYAETVIGAQGSKAAGEAAPKLFKEGTQSRLTETAIAAVNFARHEEERQEDQENLKELLLSLQNQVSRCLRQLEVGWGNKEKEPKLDPTEEGDGLKTRQPSEEKETGLGSAKPIQIEETVDKSTRQYLIKRYHRIYVRRNPPRRLGRWRPKAVGRKVQLETEELPKDGRSASPERGGGVPATENDEETGGHSRDHKIAADKNPDEAKGGGEDAGSSGQAGGGADSADKGIIEVIGALEGVGQRGDKAMQLSLIAGDEAGSFSSLGDAGDGTELAGDATDKVEKDEGSPRTHNIMEYKVTEKASVELEGAGFVVGAEGEANSADGGKQNQFEDAEGVGQVMEQVTQSVHGSGDVAGDASESDSAGRDTEPAGEIVMFIGKSDMGKEELADTNRGEIYQLGEPETLEIQPLAIMGAGEHRPESQGWVLERVLAFCHELGLNCDGHEEELLALFTAIEAKRMNRKGGSSQQKGDKVGNRGNRELKRLECTVNYDVKGSATMTGKGRNGKFC
jgi:hypothetical protein